MNFFTISDSRVPVLARISPFDAGTHELLVSSAIIQASSGGVYVLAPVAAIGLGRDLFRRDVFAIAGACPTAGSRPAESVSIDPEVQYQAGSGGRDCHRQQRSDGH